MNQTLYVFCKYVTRGRGSVWYREISQYRNRFMSATDVLKLQFSEVGNFWNMDLDKSDWFTEEEMSWIYNCAGAESDVEAFDLMQVLVGFLNK